MKLRPLLLFMGLWLICYGCDNRSLEKLKPEEINSILANVSEDDPAFVQKGISFDSIVTLAGTRTIGNKTERIKFRLYHFQHLTRGYFNLTDRDDKNLQVFGKLIDGNWVIKCVTKLNMEEVGGYIILQPDRNGIWSNGHINFKTETIALKKQTTDYDDLTSW